MKLFNKGPKKDGFDGQRAIVIPKSILSKFCVGNVLINKAYITDIGYYPKARFHFRQRNVGSEQNILIYCVDGRGKIRVDRDTHEISGGDFCLIPAGKPHAYETTAQNPWTIYWCHFKGDQTNEIIKLSQESFKSFKGNVPFSAKRIELFDSLYATLEQGYAFENLTYVNIIFPQFLSSFIFSEQWTSPVKNTKEDIIEQTLKFMQENIGKSLSLELIAKKANSSASHFSAVFKKKTGFPPIEYFNHLKIQKACQYLQFTELRMKEIAYEVGIEDQYYFSRLFTKIMTLSPSSYRQQRSSLNK